MDIEIFPKQDHIDAGSYGNLIKFPTLVHQVSGKVSQFLDDDLNPITLTEIRRNKSALFEEPEVAETVPSKLNFNATNIGQPFNINLMFSKCRVLREIENAKPDELEGQLGHRNRLFLASQCKPYGSVGRKRVHQILKKADDYSEMTTDYQIESISKPPQTCEYMCGSKRCANICKVGGKSPVKFGYRKTLFPFIEKATSSYAYFDWGDDTLYFVDSKDKLKQILADQGDTLPDTLSVYKVIFDPHQNRTFDNDQRTINLFSPTDYMVYQRSGIKVNLSKSCPTILRLISNLLPSHTEKNRFFNWLAGIIQTRNKQLTSWVFLGEQGAGKGVLLDHVLKPLFGSRQVVKVEDEQLKSQFNPWMQNALIIAFNEVAHDNRTRNSINSKVKAIITDSEVMINEKNVKTFMIENFVNALFYSNIEIPVLIEKGDRRFNVVRTRGNLRKTSWFTDPLKVFDGIARELAKFAEFLINYDYDVNLAMEVIQNTTKNSIINAGMGRFEEFAMHLKNNDFEWLNDQQSNDFGNITLKNLSGKLQKDEALKIFKNIYGDEKVTAKKLTTEMELYGIKVERIRNEFNKREYYYVWE